MAFDLEDMKFCKLAGTDKCIVFIELGDDAKPEYGKYPDVLKKQDKKKRKELEEKIKKCEQMLSGYKCPYLFAEKDYAYAYAKEKEKEKKKKATEPDEKEGIEMKRLTELEERVKKLEELNKALSERNKMLEEKARLTEMKLYEERINAKCQELLDKGYWPKFVEEAKKIYLSCKDVTIKLTDENGSKDVPLTEALDKLIESVPEEVRISFEEKTKAEMTKPGETKFMTVEEVENWAKENGMTFEEACAILAKEGKISV